jgi:hypothetical protein
MVKCGVLFELRTEFLNNIYTNFGKSVSVSISLVAVLKTHFPVIRFVCRNDVLRVRKTPPLVSFLVGSLVRLQIVNFHPVFSLSVYFYFFFCLGLAYVLQNSESVNKKWRDRFCRNYGFLRKNTEIRFCPPALPHDCNDVGIYLADKVLIWCVCGYFSDHSNCFGRNIPAPLCYLSAIL